MRVGLCETPRPAGGPSRPGRASHGDAGPSLAAWQRHSLAQPVTVTGLRRRDSVTQQLSCRPGHRVTVLRLPPPPVTVPRIASDSNGRVTARPGRGPPVTHSSAPGGPRAPGPGPRRHQPAGIMMPGPLIATEAAWQPEPGTVTLTVTSTVTLMQPPRPPKGRRGWRSSQIGGRRAGRDVRTWRERGPGACAGPLVCGPGASAGRARVRAESVRAPLGSAPHRPRPGAMPLPPPSPAYRRQRAVPHPRRRRRRRRR